MHQDKTAGRVWTHLQTQRLLVSPHLLDLVQIPAFRTNALTAAPPPPNSTRPQPRVGQLSPPRVHIDTPLPRTTDSLRSQGLSNLCPSSAALIVPLETQATVSTLFAGQPPRPGDAMTQADLVPGALPIEIQHGTLLHLLANSLILGNTAPYLSCFDLLNLAAASRTLRFLVYHTPLVFRRLDLRHVRNAQFDVVGIDRGGETWRNTQLDEALTEDE